MSIVISGREFKFSKGIFVERVFRFNSDYSYKEMGDISLDSMREFKGLKWSIFINCIIFSKVLFNGR